MMQVTLSPAGRLYLEGDDLKNFNELRESFRKGTGHGLINLDAYYIQHNSASFNYWKEFARKYLSAFSTAPDLDEHDFSLSSIRVELSAYDLNAFLFNVPPMKGGEYVTRRRLLQLWNEMQAAMHAEILSSGKKVGEFLQGKFPHWSLSWGVCFNLAENADRGERPFHFSVSYFNRFQHYPIAKAFENYSSPDQEKYLVRLLTPIQAAAEGSSFLQKMIESAEILRTSQWTVDQTYQFIKEIPHYESVGIVVKVPHSWREKQPSRPQLGLKIGEKPPDRVGLDALLDFASTIVLDNDELDESDIKDLEEEFKEPEKLTFFKDRWVEVDQERLTRILEKSKIADEKMSDGLTFAQGLRMLAGVRKDEDTAVISGQWLEDTLKKIREPGFYDKIDVELKGLLKAKLRPYQKQGVAWLHLLNQLGLGGILADDMGLGKTIQVISLMLLRKKAKMDEKKSKKKKPADEQGPGTLLVVPASLMGNWSSEIQKFAPKLKPWIAHPSGDGTEPAEEDCDLVITTYGSVTRYKWIAEKKWELIILDEAQAIKNPTAQQTRSIKKLRAAHRLALTGTPVENHPSDLWSLFDFLSPGLLGSAKEFKMFMKGTKGDDNPYAKLRGLVQPYILRRLKTDKSIISDLPEKTEVKTYCPLTQKQVELYQRAVQAMKNEIGKASGIKRRGVILSYLMRFKQICNHPSQLTKETSFPSAQSGKFMRLKEICESIADRQEKVLVFTQFKEMAEPLAKCLKESFAKEGLVLHGSVPVKKRQEMVREFQQEDGPPFFILSLKAGGTGLNLTEACHVIHFDRWWNPAIERQATDRSFRIGQKDNVLVHKFICKGTLEERIDAMLDSKQSISEEILEGDGSKILTELGDSELLNLVSLDIKSAKD